MKTRFGCTDEQAKPCTFNLQPSFADGGDAATPGGGIMTDARWKQAHDFMAKAGLLKAETDRKAADTTQFVKDLKIPP